jgi:hypothetical protein
MDEKAPTVPYWLGFLFSDRGKIKEGLNNHQLIKVFGHQVFIGQFLQFCCR